MVIAVISDSHDDLAMTTRAIELASERGAEALIHCGDLASPAIVEACSRLPAYFVFGNHDADSVPELVEEAKRCEVSCLGWGGVVELAGKRIGVAHGHMTSDLRPLLAAGCDYVLTGHSHERMDRLFDGVRRINPGALFRADFICTTRP